MGGNSNSVGHHDNKNHPVKNSFSTLAPPSPSKFAITTKQGLVNLRQASHTQGDFFKRVGNGNEYTAVTSYGRKVGTMAVSAAANKENNSNSKILSHSASAGAAP